MKYPLTTFTTIIAVGMFMTASPVLAQTPDGDTPAEETVCDALQDDGITKGLYGLCVAFCEAGDYADEFDTITPEELETLEFTSPSGRILANYNKKKDRANNPADPDMPCILVDESCPCWTADELASVGDGYVPGGAIASFTQCNYRADGRPTYLAYDFDNVNFIFDQARVYAFAGDDNRPPLHSCWYQERFSTSQVIRILSIEAGTLTAGEYLSCYSELETHWDNLTTCDFGNHP